MAWTTRDTSASTAQEKKEATIPFVLPSLSASIIVIGWRTEGGGRKKDGGGNFKLGLFFFFCFFAAAATIVSLRVTAQHSTAQPQRVFFFFSCVI